MDITINDEIENTPIDATDEAPRAVQQFRSHADGIGYDVLHPTKGWRRISAKRLAAQRKIAQMQEAIDKRRAAGVPQASFMQRVIAQLTANPPKTTADAQVIQSI